jgi:hypothetical protein
MAEQEGSEPEQEQTIITDEELLCYVPNTRVLLLAADHEKNKVGKPFLIFCNKDLQIEDHTKPITIYNGVWHSTRPSRKNHNLLGPEQLSVHDYDVPPEGMLIQTDAPPDELAQPKPDINDVSSNDRQQATSDSEPEQSDPLDQQIRHSPVEPVQLPQTQPSRLRAMLSPSYPTTTPVFPTMTMQTQLNPTSTNTQTTTSTVS